MTCPQDLMFRVLWCSDVELVCGLVNACFVRLGMDVVCKDLTTGRAWFVLLINKDVELRHYVIKGGVNVPAMRPSKAETLFQALGVEVIMPWLSNETLTELELLEKACLLYLAC
jgi:hypothetical protein